MQRFLTALVTFCICFSVNALAATVHHKKPGRRSSVTTSARKYKRKTLKQKKTSQTAVSSFEQRVQKSFFRKVYITAPHPPSFDLKMTGNWGGLRDKLFDRGVIVGFSYTNNLLGNPIGGKKHGFAYTDSTGLNLLIDLQKFANWQGWSFYLAFAQRNGEDLSAKYIGNLFSVSQLFGGETFRLANLYFNWASPEEKVSFTFGRLSAADYFLVSPLYYSYVSSIYNDNPASPFINADVSVYPFTQWGAYLKLEPKDIWVIKAAVFNTNSNAMKNKFHGFDFSFKSNNGAMLISEIELMNNEHLCFLSCRLPGRYTVGAMYFTGKGQTNFLTDQKVKGNYSFYYQLEQKLYELGVDPRRGLFSFFSMVFFPEAYNKIPFFYNTGLVLRGMSSHRSRDLIALGFAHAKFSNKLAQSEIQKGQIGQTFEENVELSYRFYVTPWFFLQPDVQYVIRPSGKRNIHNAWVFGVQMDLDF